MQQWEGFQFKPELRVLVIEASLALARLDTERLEELALSCQGLNRDLAEMKKQRPLELARQAKEAMGEMAVFGRVLEATRSNLDVVTGLRERREGRLEYGTSTSSAYRARGYWLRAESGHGNN